MLRLPAALLATALVVLVVLGAPRPGFLALRVRPVLLNPEDPSQSAVGALRYRGGLWLRSRDPRFGGLSALRVSPDGRRLVSISDCGSAFDAVLVRDPAGRLVGIAEPRLRPLARPGGGPLLAGEVDAESLAITPDGGWIVGFEGRPRLWRYPPGEPPLAGVPIPLNPPPGLRDGNRGLEALASLEDGRLLAIAEGPTGPATTTAWIEKDAAWKAMAYPLAYGPDAPGEPFRPSGAALLPSGDVLVVERRFPPIAVRLRRLSRESLESGGDLSGAEVARLEPPLSVDNFEAIEARKDPSGETVVYLLSDDNDCRKEGAAGSPSQRTLLLTFILAP